MDKLTEILASDLLNVPKEETVFEAAMLWLNKCSSRKQSFEKVRGELLAGNFRLIFKNQKAGGGSYIFVVWCYRVIRGTILHE